MAAAERAAAFRAGLTAYRAGEPFDAHELWEPAWMGTDDIPERELLQGLIKVAAAHVHRDRGNSLGMARNLAGARSRLAAARAAGVDPHGLDLARLVAAIDDRLALLAGTPTPSADAVPPIELG